MITIEEYSEKYIQDIADLVKHFHDESLKEYDSTFDEQQLLSSIKQQGEQAPFGCFLLIADGKCQGILFGFFFRSLVNGAQIFQEVIWYVRKEFRLHGIKLLRHAENVLKLKNCGIIIMAVMENSKTEKLHRFYERLGYKKMETHFVRKL